MDRSRPRPGVLAGRLALAAAAALLVAAGTGPPLKGMRWLAPGVKPAVLGARPAECLTLPADPEEAYRVELGRAAFRAPLVLGGQAARAGIACETCHQNGRANVNFDFPGLSGAPGTADVTSSLFSSHRGDDVDNPKPIPDLGGARDKLKVSQAREGRALETFIHGLVTQEFDGAEPPPAVLDGLAAYVRAMSPGACPPAARQPVRLADALGDARRAVRAAEAAIAHDDYPTAAVMIEAARSQLGAINERYAGPGLEPQRHALSGADSELALALAATRVNAKAVADDLAAWLERSNVWGAQLAAKERLSLYNPARLARLRPTPVVTARRHASN
jgi:hypothetical protein